MVDVLAGHSFEHEIATASDLGLFGLIDMNRSDMLCQWSTDQFPNSIAETALALYTIVKGGGFTSGGINFDAKVRRLEAFVDERYAGWRRPFGADILAGKHRLDDLAARVLAANTDVAPVSGRQEYLENLANQFV